MPTFFLHQRRGSTYIRDEEGADFDGISYARKEALLAAREELSRQVVLDGLLDLTSSFEITDEQGIVTVLWFSEAVEIRQPL